MNFRRQLVLVAVVASLGVWVGAGVALGSYTVTPMCTTGSQTAACSAGWYTSNVAINSWVVAPNDGWTVTSGCGLYSFAKDTSTSESCSVSGPSGAGSATQPINLEISSPTASATPSRPPDPNGWYNHPVGISFGGVLSFSGFGLAACSPATTFHGPDGANQSVAGSCTDDAGKSAPAGFTLNYDATPPTMAGASPSRPPDHSGWYNHAVTFTFSGTDSVSGIASCSQPTYAGPNSATALLTGSCTDRAGNVATLLVALRYDSTPPTLDVSASPGDGIVDLHWNASESVAPITSVEIMRSPGFNAATASMLHRSPSGWFSDSRVRDWTRYSYKIKAIDQAGNATTRTVSVTPGPRLLGPVNGAHLTSPPALRWTPMRHATYYNVQVYRGTRKVLSMWPSHSKLKLQRSWHFGGKRIRLRPGQYRWYVWPGYGRRSAARYGPKVGTSTFVIANGSRL